MCPTTQTPDTHLFSHPQSHIIVDIDRDAPEKVIEAAEFFEGKVGGVKLETSLGLSGMNILWRLGGVHSVMADRKICTIPTTTEKIVKGLCKNRASMITIHAASGFNSLRAAVLAARGMVHIFAVTELTSFEPGGVDLMDISMREHFCRRALTAVRAGVNGLICPAKMIPHIKNYFDESGTPYANLLFACPGIRPEWYSRKGIDDQFWSATPFEAIIYGAHYLIIGRPVNDDPEPLAALARITEEIEDARQVLKKS